MSVRAPDNSVIEAIWQQISRRCHPSGLSILIRRWRPRGRCHTGHQQYHTEPTAKDGGRSSRAFCSGLKMWSVMWHHISLVRDQLTHSGRKNCRHFAKHIFTYIFFNEIFWIAVEISLKFAHKGPIDNKSALVQIMAWRQWWVTLLMHMCHLATVS